MKAAIFCHFDIHGQVDDYVLHSLRVYRQFFDHVCFVSSCNLSIDQVGKVHRYADEVICKENIGYDFLSWKTGFESLILRRCHEITFINDSCYGPCRDVKSMFDQSDRSEVALWGASLSRQFRPHVQSFFMTFKEPLIRSGVARKFWDDVKIIPDKQELIMSYEIGLSDAVQAAGFKIGGMVDLGTIKASTREVVCEENEPSDPQAEWTATRNYIMNEENPNPAQLYWGEMFRSGAPLLKLESLRTNPMGVNIANVFSRLRKDRWYDPSLIINHLERVLRPDRFSFVLSQAGVRHRPV